MDNVQRVTDST